MSASPSSRTTRRLLLGALLLFALTLANCATATVGLVTSNIPLEGRTYTVLGTAETTKKWYSFDIGIVGLPLKDPPIDEAIQELLAAKGGDALVNIRYFTERAIFLFVVTQHRFHIKADVVKITGTRPQTPAQQ